jgi:hypothetical protein
MAFLRGGKRSGTTQVLILNYCINSLMTIDLQKRIYQQNKKNEKMAPGN